MFGLKWLTFGYTNTFRADCKFLHVLFSLNQISETKCTNKTSTNLEADFRKKLFNSLDSFYWTRPNNKKHKPGILYNGSDVLGYYR